ncbi:50S ribosomal protein L18 [Methylophaga sp. 42_25_T18]|nr:50S ribosomal protein L18 [Methylophaga sp. 42_25_T18]OUR89523.1 50S ribosomal protein L18 [Methylophaga sp. 42_8_T64]
MDKKNSRLRRAVKSRAKMKELQAYRLTVHRTPRHIYAQVLSYDSTKVIASASTLDAEVKKELTAASNISAAEVVGKAVAQRAVSEGVTKVSFDRSGFSYHGRVKALADAARENGLQF